MRRRTSISKDREDLVIIQVPDNFPAEVDSATKKLRQILSGISIAAKETNDRAILQRGMEILERNLAKSAREILEIIQVKK